MINPHGPNYPLLSVSGIEMHFVYMIVKTLPFLFSPLQEMCSIVCSKTTPMVIAVVS